MQSKATQTKQWTTAKETTTTQRTVQLLKQCKMEQQKVAKRRRMFRNSKAKARGKDEEIRYRSQNQDATRTGTVRAKEARAGNANEGTGNQASTTGGRARARVQIEENSTGERWCSFPINQCSKQITHQLDSQEERCFWLRQQNRQPSNTRSINSSLRSNPWSEQQSHFSRYRSSGDRSSNVEDRDVSPEVIC